MSDRRLAVQTRFPYDGRRKTTVPTGSKTSLFDDDDEPVAAPTVPEPPETRRRLERPSEVAAGLRERAEIEWYRLRERLERGGLDTEEKREIRLEMEVAHRIATDGVPTWAEIDEIHAAEMPPKTEAPKPTADRLSIPISAKQLSRIAEAFRRLGQLTPRELAEAIQGNRQHTFINVATLESRGVLRHVGERRTSKVGPVSRVYELVESRLAHEMRVRPRQDQTLREQLREEIAKRGPITTGRLAEALRLDRRRVRRCLGHMYEDGLLCIVDHVKEDHVWKPTRVYGLAETKGARTA